jgi:hypothetical protein
MREIRPSGLGGRGSALRSSYPHQPAPVFGINLPLNGTIAFCFNVFFILHLQVKAGPESGNSHAALANGDDSGKERDRKIALSFWY